MHRHAPRVSVILPVFNGADALPGAVRALGRQTFGDFEVILVDDGSTDGTRDVVWRCAREDRRVVPVLKDRNEGVAAARNDALARATGELVWFVDCDDEWSEDLLSEVVRLADTTGADAVVCGAVKAYAPGGAGVWLDGLRTATTVGREDFVRLLLEGRLKGYLWNKVLRREVLGRAPFPALTSQSDFAGLISVTGAIGVVASTPRVLYSHIGRPGSITNSRPRLGNLLACRDLVHALAARPDSWFPSDPALLTYFDHWFACLAIANTAARLRALDEDSRRCVAEARAAITLRGIRETARRDLRQAAALVVVAGAFPAFGAVYAANGRLHRVPGLARRLRRPVAHRRSGVPGAGLARLQEVER